MTKMRTEYAIALQDTRMNNFRSGDSAGKTKSKFNIDALKCLGETYNIFVSIISQHWNVSGSCDHTSSKTRRARLSYMVNIALATSGSSQGIGSYGIDPAYSAINTRLTSSDKHNNIPASALEGWSSTEQIQLDHPTGYIKSMAKCKNDENTVSYQWS